MYSASGLGRSCPDSKTHRLKPRAQTRAGSAPRAGKVRWTDNWNWLFWVTWCKRILPASEFTVSFRIVWCCTTFLLHVFVCISICSLNTRQHKLPHKINHNTTLHYGILCGFENNPTSPTLHSTAEQQRDLELFPTNEWNKITHSKHLGQT